MGKKNKKGGNLNKAKPRKDNSVFKVAGSKVGQSKGKAKAVTSSLKKMERKVLTDMRTEKADAAYNDVRGKLLQKQSQPVKQKREKPVQMEDNEPMPDLDEAADEFAKL